MDSPTDGARGNEAEAESPKIADAITPWFLLALATLAVAGAILRVAADGGVRLVDRLNETTLLYLAVGGALLLLKRIKTLSFGGYKLEMLEQIRERQVRTEDLLKAMISRVLPLLLPEPERKHLLNLASGHTRYEGGGPLQAELRRLLAAQLLEKQTDKDNRPKHISDLKQGVSFDLADYVKLTPLGAKWLESIREIETPGVPPATKSVDGGGA
jgi:hypothetical protein